jgi:hypothetical protein
VSNKVYAAINAVQAELALVGVSKDRENKQQGYAFRGIDDMYNAIAPLLAKHKLCILPSFTDRMVVERQTKSGGALFYVNVSGKFLFVSAEDGSNTTVGPFFGEAMDSGDKATNKAQSASFKYMAMQTFCIPTEGDNDADKQTHEVAAKAPEGFEDMVVDLELVAKEQGTEPLQAAWKKSKPALRKYFTDTNLAGWEAIKTKAAEFDAKKAAAEKAKTPELVGA